MRYSKLTRFRHDTRRQAFVARTKSGGSPSALKLILMSSHQVDVSILSYSRVRLLARWDQTLKMNMGVVNQAPGFSMSKDDWCAWRLSGPGSLVQDRILIRNRYSPHVLDERTLKALESLR